MAKIKEKVAYLQGLTRGLNVNDRSAEGKLLVNVVDVLSYVADEINVLRSAQDDLENYVEAIDEDLTELEDGVYEDVYDAEMVELECPSCHEVVTFESNVLDHEDIVEVTCPNCGETIYENTIEFSDADNYDTAYRLDNPGL